MDLDRRRVPRAWVIGREMNGGPRSGRGGPEEQGMLPRRKPHQIIFVEHRRDRAAFGKPRRRANELGHHPSLGHIDDAVLRGGGWALLGGADPLERHATDRTLAGRARDDLRVHGTDVAFGRTLFGPGAIPITRPGEREGRHQRQRRDQKQQESPRDDERPSPAAVSGRGEQVHAGFQPRLTRPGGEGRPREVACRRLDAVPSVALRRQRVVPVAVERFGPPVDGQRPWSREAAALALQQRRGRLEAGRARAQVPRTEAAVVGDAEPYRVVAETRAGRRLLRLAVREARLDLVEAGGLISRLAVGPAPYGGLVRVPRSEEHTSELQ